MNIEELKRKLQEEKVKCSATDKLVKEALSSCENVTCRKCGRFKGCERKQPPARIQTPTAEKDQEPETVVEVIIEDDQDENPQLLREEDQIKALFTSPLKLLGPEMHELWQEFIYSSSSSIAKKYRNLENLEKQSHLTALTDLISQQQFLSLYVTDSDLLLKTDMVNRLHDLTPQTPSTRIVIKGPKDSGKSTIMYLYAKHVLLPGLANSVTWRTTLVVPVNWDLYLATNSLDLGVVYCCLVQHFVDVLISHRPVLRKWSLQISSFFKKIVTNRKNGSLPAEISEKCETWLLSAKVLRSAFEENRYGDFITEVLTLPWIFKESFGFDKIFWLFDSVETAGTPFATDGTGRSGTVPLDATFLSSMCTVLCKPGTSICLASSSSHSATLLPHSVLVPVQNFIPASVLSLRYPSLPSLLRCNGKEYPVSVFGGCPGYLAPFIKLLQATASVQKNKASPDMQRTVEFYGSAVEDLLERLAFMDWDE
eukprot:TRINITY_DN24402_c0_g1_i1.p1 TRINITY_DN24402_c0_g1~~TRINITY_DN24402_c0_g1_i1.p1  ORF type:complete len:495 (+),score=43.41 TRINITY_DN24402_c0_g1_i1:41-1486(+)